MVGAMVLYSGPNVVRFIATVRRWDWECESRAKKSVPPVASIDSRLHAG